MIVVDRSYSPSTLNRRFKVISEIALNDTALQIVYDDKTPFAAIVDASPYQNDKGETRHRVIATLELVRRKEYGETYEVKDFWQDSDALQVESVVVIEAMRDFRLATTLYETLVTTQGITLMSDNEQYVGGKQLWKKIAANSTKLVVFVLDTEQGKFYPYDGAKVRYDGASIPEDCIWSIHPDKTHSQVILIAEDHKKIKDALI